MLKGEPWGGNESPFNHWLTRYERGVLRACREPMNYLFLAYFLVIHDGIPPNQPVLPAILEFGGRELDTKMTGRYCRRGTRVKQIAGDPAPVSDWRMPNMTAEIQAPPGVRRLLLNTASQRPLTDP